MPAGFTDTLYGDGLARPVAMDMAPDGRVFVVEQGGDVRIVKGGRVLPTPFLSLAVDERGERGLLGVTLHPNFAQNQFVYVYYTVPATSTEAAHNRVSRFTANGNVAVPGSERVIIDLDPLQPNTFIHNGGALHFGNGGLLYIAVGDNGDSANAQSLQTVLGKVLRIHADGRIPTDNPFFNQTTGNDRAIWALGLRNPFSFAVQPETNRIFVNDVGQNSWEEINRLGRGANYGWPITEGPTTDPRFVGPLYAYQHGSGVNFGNAIAGAVFYNPATRQFPADYVGDYFFGDFVNGWIKRYDVTTRSVQLFASALPPGLVDLEISAAGGLYYLVRGSGAETGQLHRVNFPARPAALAPDAADGDQRGRYAAFISALTSPAGCGIVGTIHNAAANTSGERLKNIWKAVVAPVQERVAALHQFASLVAHGGEGSTPAAGCLLPDELAEWFRAGWFGVDR